MTPMSRRLLVVVLAMVTCTGLNSGCSEAPELSPQKPAQIYRVQHLTTGHDIQLADRSLAEWQNSLVVVAIAPQDAKERQWRRIRGHVPKNLSPSDIAIKVYMARDSEYWYIAAAIRDDKVLPGSPEHPYSGDCLEIFFAGKELDSPKDFHNHVETNTSSDQAAFFQLELGPGATNTGWDYFPNWRTDFAFKKNAISNAFQAFVWPTESGWNAEAKVSLSAFQPEVRARIQRREPLRINVDYLDYDTRTANRTKDDDWGFLPDNVFGLDPTEGNVYTPEFMRSVVFE